MAWPLSGDVDSNLDQIEAKVNPDYFISGL